MVAARVAEEEEPRVLHRGWAPRPRGRKAARRWQRLGREAAWAASSRCQYWQTAVFTVLFHVCLVVGGEVRVTIGVGEAVLDTDLPNLAEPGLLDAVMEDVKGVAVEDVTVAQSSNHQEQA